MKRYVLVKVKKKYSKCCEKYHLGKSTCKNAQDLMRSRFSAYALKLSDYIIKTSHKKNPCFQKDLKTLKKDIESFCSETHFKNLEILDNIQEKNQAFVTFIATLISNGKDMSFTEISHFEKIDQKWFYKDGQIFKGAKRNL